MFDDYVFDTIAGKDSGYKLQLFGLSTCGYCKSALKYLKECGFQFSHILLDEIPVEKKQFAKKIFKDKFNKRMSFPTLLIDEEDYLIGFIKIAWDQRLGKKNEK